MSEKQSKEELIAESIYFLANEIRFLGMGNADRSQLGMGAIEGHTIKLCESNENISGSIESISDSIDSLSQSVDKSNTAIANALNNVAESIQLLAKAVLDKG